MQNNKTFAYIGGKIQENSIYLIMKESNPRVIRIFVGEGDFRSQAPLAEKRRRQGWVMGKRDDSPKIRQATGAAKGAIVIGNGADARLCMAAIIDDSFASGAKRVVIPLHQIRTAFGTDDSLFSCALALARGLEEKGRSLDDARLLVTPTAVWKRAIAQVEKETQW